MFVCFVSGWFPFLFYSTTWVGETYFRYEVPQSTAQKSTDMLGDVGRLGSLSLVIFSLINVISSVLIPFGVISPENRKSSISPKVPKGMRRLLKRFSFFRPDLNRAWMVSHIMFAVPMIFAPFARSVRFATLLVASCGIPWAVSCWAPFAFMGIEINRLGLPAAPRTSTATMITSADTNLRRSTYYHDSADGSSSDIELDRDLLLNHRREDDTDVEEDDGMDQSSSTGELAGIYLGVLNIYTTLPQFVGTFISWIVFSILEPNKDPPTPDTDQPVPPADGEKQDSHWMNLNSEGPNAIGVCLFIGALSALIATEATRRLRYVR